ncbi:mycofactocin biosynthesis glycosyltransferase MftF [Nakamurella multipartita]|jgi:mycofactocin system glycosyltransferase|uniref:Glycosyl transferase family 2 n=1 Tax=Nakamurella multipartita (strain ATCC 700099 / DSM 44233 / CIP 104796 / JCM 9543 / NBRC 105858 / Y-104) TaxID=479431 RepID=C8X9B6_NAKMY|nr:mycofactocin biosynthesis glycosyltransferase MftF [Nakamurella multipartita]ACV77184.1 glycosyl transferase family 2 [Nakamurella multipartita DSM 44233]
MSRPSGAAGRAVAQRWRLGPGTSWLDRTTLAGGAPYRVITMTDRGADIVRELLDGRPRPPEPAAVEELVRRLRTAGLLVAPAPAAAGHDGVTVVIPARSAAGPVRELLATLPADLPVILVDDGSPDPLAGLADERPGLQVLRHERFRGPAAARNAGAALARTPWIAFLDADTIPDRQWIGALKAHLTQTADTGGAAGDPGPRVLLAAPQIVPLPGTGSGGWFEERVCALDLGADPSDVGPGRAVSYVPSAAMLVDAEAFRRAGGFNEAMHVGEDVDLVWRLLEQGAVRYYPTVHVAHRPRGTLTAALNRRRLYGTGAADLAAKHPGALQHLDVSIWSLGPWLLAVLAQPALGVAAAAVTAVIAPWGMPELSPAHARKLAALGHLRAGAALGRWLIRPMLPVTLLVGLLRPRVGRRLAVAAAAGLAYQVAKDVRAGAGRTGPAQRDPGRIGLVRLAAETLVAHALDDAAYSLGVWQGVLRHRNPEPVLPRVRDLPRWRRRRTVGSS